ncbi:zinc finger protein BRUTUS-like [Populus alba x Populus x berolinensis]|uniref:Zinc finger protein BRUTUS-like n=1 Tax=Populus alba x Populus x berolinensis TaxID=444605 RepID=A0AAD6PWQ1_9ROSI|nr:zinc finger protein BRUTUS-like [Populus alba x Populus x berolinensis]
MDSSGVGDSPKLPPDKDRDAESPWPPIVVGAECFSNIRLTDAPILLLVHFHEALRVEIADLRRLAVTASEAESEARRPELVVELRRRFDFLKLAYKYHSATEDEVIFLALDTCIKNVARTYSLEHESILDLFGTIFHWLDRLEENKSGLKPFQELVVCIGTMQSSICQHMLKEEEQVFPLLMQQFSPSEQASLVWQFICSVPVIVLEDLLPWMYSFFCPEKQVETVQCIRQMVPKEESLQEVVISWLLRNDQSSPGAIRIGQGNQDVPNKMKSILQLQSSKRLLGQNQQRRKRCVQTDGGKSLVDYLHLWHVAIQKEWKEILEELYQIGTLISALSVDSILFRLKFLADVIIFYSIALKRFFYPVLKLANKHMFPSSSEQSSIENHIESLHKLLYCQKGLPSCKFVEKLCQEMKSLAMDVTKQFNFYETEVFPFISKNCSLETQLQILYRSLHVMPLGLLKCAITWFAVHLAKNESRSILDSMNLGDVSANKSFTSLLLEWFHISYSGKTSMENFCKDLEKVFRSRYSILPEQIKDVVSLSSQTQACKESKSINIELVSANKGKNFLSYALSPGSHKGKARDTSYTSEINLHIFFPGTLWASDAFLKLPGGESSSTPTINQPVPMDFIFLFHKALMKDLEDLVFGSVKLAENIGFLTEFHRHFHLLQFWYQFHSDAEDEIVFPALEAKEEVRNISHSYTIDHKLEVEYFNEVSHLLDKMSELHISASIDDSEKQDQILVKHNRLCMKLHYTCKSMHKLLSDHVHREEVELWPMFRECFSIQEQEKIIGRMLGNIKAETLQDMIPWLLGSLTPEEQRQMMSLWRHVAKNTMFDEWLREWWEGSDIAHVATELNTSCTPDPLDIIARYLPTEALDKQGDDLNDTIEFSQRDFYSVNIEKQEEESFDDKVSIHDGDQNNDECSECKKLLCEGDKERFNEVSNLTNKTDKPGQPLQLTLKSKYHERLLKMSQDDMEAAIRRVSRESSLDHQKKSFIIQNLIMSRWIVHQKISHTEVTISSNGGEEIPGQHPSYRDSPEPILGCKHYKRNCKLVMPCCDKIYTCIRCHDELADHSTDRRAITKMMCMECLIIQPIGETCSTVSCNNLSMGRYYCRICKLLDDEREIYHCPYCNLCRVGKGLGIDYFHCMNCNACMARSLSVHVCREKCLEDNCPICHEYIFTSSTPVKALYCGHLMHSTCFQVPG